MLKFNSLTLSTTLFFIGTVWGDAAFKETEVKPTNVNFPYDNAQWFTQETLLIWKPFVEDLDYGVKSTTVKGDNPNVAVRFKPEKQNFDWQSGVRVGIGRYLSGHDSWDVTATGTYFYADSKDSSSPNFDKGAKLTPLWTPIGQQGPLDHGSSAWSLNFYTVDFSIGREFTMIPTISVHPFIGIRSAFIFQKNKADYSGIFTALTNLSSQDLNVNFKSHSDFWGVGPRLGTDFTLKLGKHFAFLGSFAAGLYMGQYENTGKVNASIIRTSNGALGSTNQVERFKIKDPGYTIRSNIEGSLGLGWEWNYTKNNRDVRIAPSILFEASEWFGFNQYPRLQSAPLTVAQLLPLKLNSQLDEYDRLLGDLGFVGVSINLQVDF